MFLLVLHEKQAAMVFQKPYLCAAFALPMIEHALLRLPRAKPVLLPAPLGR